ncbi:MAG TPA: zf-HC2 domain-containing protein [Thermoanaerobaculia bacterium]
MTRRPYITCRELFDFIHDYLSNELPADERAELERHLAVCPSCVVYLESYRATEHMARAVADDDAPSDAPEELIAAILAARRT